MLISHSYVAGEMKPNFMIKLNSCTGIVNGNIMINESSDTMSEIINSNNSKAILATNLYKTVSGEFLTNTDSTVTENANMELL